MKTRAEVPRYATVLYEVRKKLDVSFSEYIYLDMVHKLSYQRWCTKSLQNCADDLGISRRAIINMKNRLLERGLLEKNLRGHLRVTDKYTGVAVHKLHQTPHMVVNKVPKMVKKLHSTGEETSLIENNNRITKNNSEPAKLGAGYAKWSRLKKQFT